MPIPDYQTLMLPLLQLIAAHNPLNREDAVHLISEEYKLPEDERKQLLPSGKFTVIRSRVGWARTYLKKAGLIDYPKRGIAEITDRGKKALSEKLDRIDLTYLRQFPEFCVFENTTTRDNTENPGKEISIQTPEELLENAYVQLKQETMNELIDKIKSCSPDFFEELVVNIIVKIGYGGSVHDAGRAIGKTGDEGIDGIIKEDKLGLDVIYLQAKRWQGNVGRPEIHKFAGALQGKRARKGILITTSDFTAEAKQYVENIDMKIILISGQKLAELMWEENIGLSNVSTYEVKKLDLDFFTE